VEFSPQNLDENSRFPDKTRTMEIVERTPNQMFKHKLLWIAGQAFGPAAFQCPEALDEFAVTQVDHVPGQGNPNSLANYDCVLISGVVPQMDAVDALDVLHTANPLLPVVFWNPELKATDAVRLVRCGAYQCLGQGDSADGLRDALTNAVEEKRLRSKAQSSASQSTDAWRNLLIGESQAMEEVVETIQLVGSKRCTVLVSGESGTGKERAARAIHICGRELHRAAGESAGSGVVRPRQGRLHRRRQFTHRPL
jgi:CheY-like chemotaxis protein